MSIATEVEPQVEVKVEQVRVSDLLRSGSAEVSQSRLSWADEMAGAYCALGTIGYAARKEGII